MQQNFEKRFFVVGIIAFKPVGGISLIYDKNICDRQSTFYQRVLGFRIRLREIFYTSICPRLKENWDKCAAVELSAVPGTREEFGFGRVF